MTPVVLRWETWVRSAVGTPVGRREMGNEAEASN
jgi:hypothetical protein